MNTLFFYYRFYLIFLGVLGLWAGGNTPVKAQKPCDSTAIACTDNLLIFLGKGDSIKLLPSMFLEGKHCPDEDYDMRVFTKNKIYLNPTVSLGFPKKTLIGIENKRTGNSCWSTLTLLYCNGDFPEFQCPEDIAQGCLQSRDPEQTGFPIDIAKYPITSNKRTSYVVSECDTCPDYTLTYADSIVAGDCSDTFPTRYYRRWKISNCDESKHCTQSIFIRRDTIPDDFGLHNYDGVDRPKIGCDDTYPKTNTGNPSPSYTGSPVTAGCNLMATTYNDIVFKNDCDMPIKILRKWKVFDWCTSSVKEHIQLIFFEDCGEDTIKPTPYCEGGVITILLKANGSITVWASDFDLGSWDNCGIATISFDPQGKEKSKVFRKAGTYQLKVYFIDYSGNKEYCEITLKVVDANNSTHKIIGGRFLDYNLYPTVKKLNLNVELVDKDFNNIPVHQCNPKDKFLNYWVCSSNGSIDTPVIFDARIDTTSLKRDQGLSVLDLVLIQKYLLGKVKFNRIQTYAADVNCSLNVSTADIVLLLKRILGIVRSFPCEEFKLLKPDLYNLSEFQAIEINSLPAFNVDMVPVHIGDVSGNWNNSLRGTKVKVRSGRVVDMYLEEQTFTKGQNYSIWLKLDKPFEFEGVQLSLAFNNNFATITNIESPFISGGELTYHISDENKIKLVIVHHGVSAFKVTDSWLKLSFTALEDTKTTEIFSNNPDFRNLYVTNDNQEYPVHIHIGPMVATKDVRFEHTPLISPNPFNDKISIDLFGQAVEEGDIQLFDVNGRMLWYQPISRNENRLVLDADITGGWPQGIYYLKIMMGKKLYIQKMIKSH